MKRIILCTLTLGLICGMFGANICVLDDKMLSEINGGALLSDKGLSSDTCGTVPSGWTPSSQNCKLYKIGTDVQLSVGWVVSLGAGATMGTDACYGGCQDQCQNSAFRDYCTCQTGSTCDTDDENPCTGGTAYSTPAQCDATLDTPCAGCSYVDNGSC